MKRAKTKKRFKFRRKLASLFFLASCGITSATVAGGTAQAQQTSRSDLPASRSDLPAKTYMKQSVFYLPVKIDERMRSSLREVRLYCKEGPNRPWQLKDKASPGQTYFTFRAPRDGEYWFTVVTVDKSGRSTPTDLRNEPPGLIVVQDTQLPQVDVRPVGNTDEGTLVQCVIRDANPDLTKTRFSFQTGDGSWQTPTPSTKRPDQYCIPSQAVFTGMVRVEATDLAGNTMNREFNLGTAQVARSPSSGQTLVQTSSGGTTKVTPPAPMAKTPASVMNKVPGQFPVETVENAGPELIPAAHHTDAAAPGAITTDNKIVDPVTEGSHETIVNPVPQTPKTPIRHLVNKTHVYLNYQIEDKGPSGVGKIAIYITRDQGQSWQKLSEAREAKNPIDFDLPGEGVYGISLAISNGRGFGGAPPAPGDVPDWCIEVDMTKPAARIADICSGEGSDVGCMVVTWNALDKNLPDEPIELFYAASRQGPWHPIAKGLRNDGHYRWEVPGNVGAEAFIRLLVRDAAGNVTIADTAQAVTLDDRSRPHARVISVGTAPSHGEN
jgi:hypothetical protein